MKREFVQKGHLEKTEPKSSQSFSPDDQRKDDKDDPVHPGGWQNES